MDLKYYEFGKLQCNEMAIWPLPYIDEKRCESISSARYFKNLFFFHSFFNASIYLQITIQTIIDNPFFNNLNPFFNNLFFNRHPDYQRSTCSVQSPSPRYSIFPRLLTSSISSLIGGCTRQSQVHSSYS